MAPQEILNRLDALEAEIAELRRQLGESGSGWKAFVGAFRGDKTFAKAMKAGRRYRQSSRPEGKRKP